MTVKDQLKVLDRKIKQNKADYDLYRQNAEIYALSSGDLNKYEYLTKKDLGYKPDPIQKVKFEYSPLGQVFNKGLKKDEKSEGLLKRLKNIEDKTDNNNLRVIEGPRREDPHPRISFNNFRQELTPERFGIVNRIINERRNFNNYIVNNFRGGNNQQCNFSGYMKIGDLFNRIYNGEFMIREAQREQKALDYDYNRLERCRPRPNCDYYQIRLDVLNNVGHLKNGRELLINAFRNRILPLGIQHFIHSIEVLNQIMMMMMIMMEIMEIMEIMEKIMEIMEIIEENHQKTMIHQKVMIRIIHQEVENHQEIILVGH